jgi:hypothetical protein
MSCRNCEEACRAAHSCSARKPPCQQMSFSCLLSTHRSIEHDAHAFTSYCELVMKHSLRGVEWRLAEFIPSQAEFILSKYKFTQGYKFRGMNSGSRLCREYVMKLLTVLSSL